MFSIFKKKSVEERTPLLGEDEWTSDDLLKYESYTVEWQVFTHTDWLGKGEGATYRKTFIYEDEALTFKKRLRKAANFTHSWISIEVIKS